MDFESRLKDLIEQESLGILGDLEQLQKRTEEYVRSLEQFNIPIDLKFQQILDVGKAAFTTAPISEMLAPAVSEPIVEEKLTGNQLRAQRTKAKVQKELEDLALEVLEELTVVGPDTSSNLVKRMGGKVKSDYKMGKVLKYLRDEKQVDFRTEVFQGPTVWYTFSAPVSMSYLREWISKQPKGQVSPSDISSDKKLLPKEAKAGLERMFRKLVSEGVLTRREGRYFKEDNPVHKRDSNGKKDHKQNFSGGGVATSGDQLTSDKEVRAVISKLKQQGAVVSGGRGGHIQVQYGGKTTTIGRTPSPQGLREDKQNLKNIGLNV